MTTPRWALSLLLVPAALLVFADRGDSQASGLLEPRMIGTWEGVSRSVWVQGASTHFDERAVILVVTDQRGPVFAGRFFPEAGAGVSPLPLTGALGADGAITLTSSNGTTHRGTLSRELGFPRISTLGSITDPNLGDVATSTFELVKVD